MKKQVIVSVDRGETRVALLEATGTPAAKPTRGGRGRRKANPAAGYRVAELYLERRGNRSIVGNIYKGKVDNVLPGLEAAFVDIGLDKNGFLHVDEIVLPGVETPRRGRGKDGGKKISDLLKPGQEVVVQVVKDPLKTKGARLSMELTIAGRYMVYTPTGEGVGVSKRLDDKERERLRRAAKGLELHGGGAIIRTAASGAKREDFERELQYLFKLHEVLEQRVETSPAPSLVFQEADLSVRVVRDIFSEHFERAVVDDEKQHHRLVSFFSRTAPELVDRVELYQESEPLFEAYGVEEVILGLVSRRVDLPSGGYLMIDYAEALTVIDVNSGSFVGRGKQARLEDTITRTNLEAAEAVVNELRLRDIGGIIVIDFIDMARARNRDAVLKTLRKALDEDRTKTFTAEISKLGLVEMTRQNVTEGVREIMTRPCPTCDGDGVVLSEETVAIEFERRLRELGDARAAQDRGVPRADEPAGVEPVHRQRRAGAAPHGDRDRQALPVHRLGGPPDRPLRGGHGGRPRRDPRRGHPVPRRRRGARHDRRAAHVRGRRRGREDRRLHRVGRRRRRARGREAPRADRRGRADRGERGARRQRREPDARQGAREAPRHGGEAARDGGEAARGREEARGVGGRGDRRGRRGRAGAARRASRRKPAADPVEEAPDTPPRATPTAPRAAADAAGGDEAPATPRRRTRRKPAPVDPEAEALEQQADDAEDAVGADAPEGPGEGDAVESKPRRRGRRGGRRRSAAKAEATPAD